MSSEQAFLLTHPSCVQVERHALFIAVQDLRKITMGKEDAALQEWVCGLPCHLFYSVHQAGSKSVSVRKFTERQSPFPSSLSFLFLSFFERQSSHVGLLLRRQCFASRRMPMPSAHLATRSEVRFEQPNCARIRSLKFENSTVSFRCAKW